MKNVFLYGNLAKQVYIEQTLGYVVQEENNVCLLRKAIYGLKQSPRVWFDKFSRVVMSFGFMRCVVEHLVFIKKNTNGCVLLAVYVDDIILIGSDTIGIRETK